MIEEEHNKRTHKTQKGTVEKQGRQRHPNNLMTSFKFTQLHRSLEMSTVRPALLLAAAI